MGTSNGKDRRITKKLCTKPTPANFRYSDLRTILKHFGYIESNKGATSGSRVKFYHPETKAAIMLHKPHPGDEMVKSAIDSVVIFLKEHSHI
ncbi:MAG: type II toxin-antitoxin system HicA family toxin [bacterium]|nr:type II toxin-antitoxin system HicA family toxin [bacterium]